MDDPSLPSRARAAIEALKRAAARAPPVRAPMAPLRAQWNNARMARALLALLSLYLLLPAAGALAKPRIALSECRLPHPAGLGSVPARCGSYAVPENPAEPGGRSIRLAVAVVPAVDRRHAREPLFVVAGGPGQSAADFYAAYAGAFATVQRSHDLVLLDQRGTGGSNRLSCDFPEDFELEMPLPQRVHELSAACLKGLAGRPQYYTTSVAVRDLEAVRAALGYPRIDLYGVSYGTRVVQHYVRHHGAQTHAVVLDGVLAPDRPLGPDTPFDAQRALDLMFARCRSEPDCERAFPSLAARFAALRTELAAHPRSVSLADPADGKPRTLMFDALQLVGAVRLLNYSAQTTSLLPLFIDRAAAGDYAPFASQVLMVTQQLGNQVAYGMNAAVVCTEDLPAAAHVDRAALERTYLGAAQIDGLAALCAGWPPGVVDADLHAPLDSPVAALLLSGEADPVTPPASAERAAQGFRDSLHVVVPGQGHGQLALPCVPRVIAAFLDAGTTRGLDVSCLKRQTPAPFVIDYAGPAP
jgi:pimeloyl-ACP methyl ester carboxylesterase